MPDDGRLVEITTYRPAAREGQDARRQAECVRQLRNEVCENLTRSTKEITTDEQWAWWNSPDALRRCIVIVEAVTIKAPDPTFAGFGMVQPMVDKGWLTGALHARYRGKGHGRALFRYLIGQCRLLGLTPWLEVFQDNEIAKALYVDLGFAWRDAMDGSMGRRILVGEYVGTARGQHEW